MFVIVTLSVHPGKLKSLPDHGHRTLDLWVDLQSLSEVVGTHVVLDCKWIITVFYTQYRSPPPPPPQSMLLQPKHIKPDEKWGTQH
jgi:hypothetical protein